jgi:hypothetical protein
MSSRLGAEGRDSDRPRLRAYLSEIRVDNAS